MVHVLCLGLNDDSYRVRVVLVRLLGRLAPRNSDMVSPPLMKTLVQVVAEVEYSHEVSA